MSDRAFIAAMEALQHEQEAHIVTLRQDAARMLDRDDLLKRAIRELGGDLAAIDGLLTPEDAEDHLLAIDVKEAMQRELLSTIALMHEFEGT